MPLTRPPARDGSHDFDFLPGTWQLVPNNPEGGPSLLGRALVRRSDDGALTMEWNATQNGSSGRGVREDQFSGSMTMSYDSASAQWTIRESETGSTAVATSAIGHFENGMGSFYGRRTDVGRTVLVRLTWAIWGLGRARFERAFSADGGTSWETNRILQLSLESTGSARRSVLHATCCQRLEVAWYSVPEGKEQNLVDLFHREAFATGDSVPVQDAALLRSLDQPATFALMRGFEWSNAPRDFYEGPLWGAHRAVIQHAGIRVDSVYELRPELRRPGFVLGDRPSASSPSRAPGIVVATVFRLDWRNPGYHYFPAYFVQYIAPRIMATGARLLAAFATDDWQLADWTGQAMATTVPSRPVPHQRLAFVAFTWFADTVAYARHREALARDAFWRETIMPELDRFIASPLSTWRVVPVGRSRPFLDWRNGP